MMQSGSPLQLRTVLLVSLVMLISTSCVLQRQPPVATNQATVDYHLLLTVPAEPLSLEISQAGTGKPLLSGLFDLNRYRNRQPETGLTA